MIQVFHIGLTGVGRTAERDPAVEDRALCAAECVPLDTAGTVTETFDHRDDFLGRTAQEHLICTLRRILRQVAVTMQVVVVAVVIEQQLNRTAAVGSKPAVSAADFLFAEMLQKCQRCPAGFGQTVHGHQAKAAVEQGRLQQRTFLD